MGGSLFSFPLGSLELGLGRAGALAIRNWPGVVVTNFTIILNLLGVYDASLWASVFSCIKWECN